MSDQKELMLAEVKERDCYQLICVPQTHLRKNDQVILLKEVIYECVEGILFYQVGDSPKDGNSWSSIRM